MASKKPAAPYVAEQGGSPGLLKGNNVPIRIKDTITLRSHGGTQPIAVPGKPRAG